MDPLRFRRINAIRPGDTTPTQVLLTSSKVGNVEKCIDRLHELMDWEKGQLEEISLIKYVQKESHAPGKIQLLVLASVQVLFLPLIPMGASILCPD